MVSLITSGGGGSVVYMTSSKTTVWLGYTQGVYERFRYSPATQTRLYSVQGRSILLNDCSREKSLEQEHSYSFGQDVIIMLSFSLLRLLT